ncbi:uncharacterized protein DFL_005774 [Arthrobotrys flagrans]|uniref:Hydrophobin n=1 Tax=Arthrobotrys flagrans TaxID=97331 RepID=A0A436ZYC2_ARTFL|nr:hypothetical protein DFL_005774 [Arthrobotrys flagrans]
MHSSTLFAFIALTLGATALPNSPVGKGIVFPAGNDVTMVQANKACGKDMKLNCCNDVDISESAQGDAAGLLGLNVQNVLGKVGLFGKCSDISIPIVNLVPVNNFLNNKCKQNVACCQDSGTTQNGILNVGLPCLALGGLL